MLSKYSSYILCFLISIFVVALYVNDFSPLQRLQWKIQDIMYSFRGDDNFSSDIILVNIDDKTLQEYGQWKWNRDKIGDLLAAIGSGQPKTVRSPADCGVPAGQNPARPSGGPPEPGDHRTGDGNGLP